MRKIIMAFPHLRADVPVKLLEDKEPEMCEAVWKVLEKPTRMICQHTLSTGDYFQLSGRPPRHPVKLGSQAFPLGRSRVLLCQLEPGSMIYAGGYEFAVAYGPHVTEPLMARGPVVGRVPEEALQDLWKGGRSIWEAQDLIHRLVIITLSREEM